MTLIRYSDRNQYSRKSHCLSRLIFIVDSSPVKIIELELLVSPGSCSSPNGQHLNSALPIERKTSRPLVENIRGEESLALSSANGKKYFSEKEFLFLKFKAVYAQSSLHLLVIRIVLSDFPIEFDMLSRSFNKNDHRELRSFLHTSFPAQVGSMTSRCGGGNQNVWWIDSIILRSSVGVSD